MRWCFLGLSEIAPIKTHPQDCKDMSWMKTIREILMWSGKRPEGFNLILRTAGNCIKNYKNCKNYRNDESWRHRHPPGRSHHQSSNTEESTLNTYMQHYIDSRLHLNSWIYVYTYVYVTTEETKRTYEFAKCKEAYVELFGGRKGMENVVITL